MSNITETDRDAAKLVNIRLEEGQTEWLRLDDETGILDMPISVVRQLSEWLKRYDMRPKNGAPVVSRSFRP